MIEAIKEELTDLSARGLADAFSRALRADAIAPGERLPSIRTVARELSLSPTTVSAAWRMLARANLIHTDGARGTVVADGVGQGPVRHRRALQYEGHFEIDLSTGLPDPTLLPDLGPSLARIRRGGALESFLAEPILPQLRDHLLADWPSRAEVMTIADGATDALDLIAMTCLQFGDRVGVEFPSYPPLLDLLEATGARIVPIDLDDSGPVTASVHEAVKAGVRAIFLQPRAQNPTGVCLTPPRAEDIAAVLRDRDVLLVEFDLCAGIAATPLVTIGEHVPSLTVHIRAYSESHGPDLRLAAVGGPASLMEPLIRRRHLGQGWTSRLLQRLLWDLLNHAEPRQQVQNARREYAQRRKALVSALADHGVRIGGKDGIVIWVPVENEAAALMMLSSHGIGVAPGTPYQIRSPAEPHLAVTTGSLPESQVAEVAAVLAQAARPSLPRSIH
ncbi:aminotransferase-like domain-containing protein [Actinomadura soli]|nr:PLP-dependent aminotransferase family protein [Actinomadura soli]